MVYKLLNKLFGWDYIQWSNSVTYGASRVYKDYDSGAYYWRYKSTKLADRIHKRDQVIWLTCPPEKYGFKK